jgi:hypothetical protein
VSDDNTTAAKSDPILDGPESAAEADIIDLGDLFSKRIAKNKKEAKVKVTVELVPGLKLKVLESPAVVAQLRLSDAENDDGAFLNALLKVVHESDRPRFFDFLNQDGIDSDTLIDIYKTLVEAGGDGRPTKRSPNSRGTSTRKRRTTS